MIAPTALFNSDQGQVTDFSKVGAGAVFNQSVVPLFDQLQEFTERQNQQLETETAEDIYRKQSDDQFLQQLQTTAPSMGQMGMMPQNDSVNYDVEPTASAAPAVSKQPAPTKGGFKLSNYGYDSDSSPDYNSNVLKIGHANNPLKDGVSAALTKSLARRHGLKTGDMFEAVLGDGSTIKRRYDDTVPVSYRGKKLPETVDLYERKGSNKFGGRVMKIQAIR